MSVISRLTGFEGGCRFGSTAVSLGVSPVSEHKKKKHTLRLELHVGLLHDPEIRVIGKHLRPFFHAFEDFRLDLLMGVLVLVRYTNPSFLT